MITKPIRVDSTHLPTSQGGPRRTRAATAPRLGSPPTRYRPPRRASPHRGRAERLRRRLGLVPLGALAGLAAPLTALAASPSPWSPGFALPLGEAFLLFDRGLIATLLTIVLIGGLGVALVVGYLRNIERNARKAMPTPTSTDSVRQSLDGLTALKVHDINFSLDDFIPRVRERAGRINAAQVEGQLDTARRYVSDALYQRFRTERAVLERQDRRLWSSDLQIRSTGLLALDSDGDWDTIHVLIKGERRQLELPLGLSPEAVREQLAAAPFVAFDEVWSLARQAGAKTAREGDVLGGQCPACFVPLPADGSVGCARCKVLCNSGTHDWVVVGIAPLERWQIRLFRDETQSFRALKQRDPGLTRERIRDQAMLLFWRWLEARVLGAPDHLRPLSTATPSALSITAGVSESITRPWLGLAELISCDAISDGQHERCYVRVHWSAAHSTGGLARPHRDVLVLVRRVGVPTSPGRASLACRHCLSPLVEEQLTECASCGSALRPGERDWALETILTPIEAEKLRRARARTTRSPILWEESLDLPLLTDPRERELLMGMVASLLAERGALGVTERRMLERCATTWNISRRRLERLIRLSRRPSAQPSITTDEERYTLLSGMVAAILIDERIMEEELALLELVSRSLGLPSSAMNELLARGQGKRRASLERAA